MLIQQGDNHMDYIAKIPRAERITNICKQCGKEFITTKARARNCCTQTCGAKYREKPGTTFVTKNCKYCGKEFKFEPWKKLEFCNRSCAAYYNQGKQYPIETKVCKNCNKIFTYSPSNSKGIIGLFCSSKC